MKKALILSLITIILFSGTAFAEDYVMKERSISTSELSTFRFLQFSPEEQSENVPLIVYLHGGSGKGDDIGLVRSYLFPSLFEDGTYSGLNAYAVCPQVPSAKKGWADISASVFELIDYMCENYNIDERKISLVGHSMGGTGTWSLAISHPERFCCIVPMSGSVKNTDANRKALGIMPIRAFVGSADTIVAPEASTEFTAALKQTNAILSYSDGRVGIKTSYAGKYTLIFTHFESGILQNIAFQEYDFAYGRSAKAAPFELNKSDKVFLWDTFYRLTPISEAFTIK